MLNDFFNNSMHSRTSSRSAAQATISEHTLATMSMYNHSQGAILSPTPRVLSFPTHHSMLDVHLHYLVSFMDTVSNNGSSGPPLTPPELSPSTPSTSPPPFEPERPRDTPLQSSPTTQFTVPPIPKSSRSTLRITTPVHCSHSLHAIAIHPSPRSTRQSHNFSHKHNLNLHNTYNLTTDHIKRPKDAFIVFCRECCLKKNEAEAALPAEEERKYWGELAKQRKKEHEEMNTHEERKYWGELAKQRKKEHEEMNTHVSCEPGPKLDMQEQETIQDAITIGTYPIQHLSLSLFTNEPPSLSTRVFGHNGSKKQSKDDDCATSFDGADRLLLHDDTSPDRWKIISGQIRSKGEIAGVPFANDPEKFAQRNWLLFLVTSLLGLFKSLHRSICLVLPYDSAMANVYPTTDEALRHKLIAWRRKVREEVEVQALWRQQPIQAYVLLAKPKIKTGFQEESTLILECSLDVTRPVVSGNTREKSGYDDIPTSDPGVPLMHTVDGWVSSVRKALLSVAFNVGILSESPRLPHKEYYRYFVTIYSQKWLRKLQATGPDHACIFDNKESSEGRIISPAFPTCIAATAGLKKRRLGQFAPQIQRRFGVSSAHILRVLASSIRYLSYQITVNMLPAGLDHAIPHLHYVMAKRLEG
ncbi:uncharacterized protein FOMMEDRAFT_155779 [Fomitiporia mediterranea MF3/22]|uniref:uncharacterized protein n=1 Tax=Fomitiporia mediterranea (strain MF3/22) TaxID=694068 RepID=UPI0004407C6D|nr:uncharacterized protein FOMMEDRAFT_155779 [Fomitiporia mediterranea MF3/22]EJD04626.1 hypothetical protein FOMMEDRAFT_155779 [Fomitiporia mediterranea MF3/22]